MQLTDDGQMAIVHLVAVDRAALADKRPEVRVFEMGKDKPEAIEAEMQKYRKSFKLAVLLLAAAASGFGQYADDYGFSANWGWPGTWTQNGGIGLWNDGDPSDPTLFSLNAGQSLMLASPVPGVNPNDYETVSLDFRGWRHVYPLSPGQLAERDARQR